jgi:predicted DCC family thiol-disulfide oxidoreductase YuxK
LQKLIVFFDSYCPLCVAEMNQLALLDTKNLLQLEDIHQPDFASRYPTIDPVAADRVLHGMYEDGTMIYGLDVTHRVWQAVGKKPWVAMLRWPVIRLFADISYRIFAKNRYSISWLLTGKRRCEPCAKDKSSSCTL